MHELKRDYTIVVVTHNMQQAARVADMTAFFSISKGDEGHRSGVLVEYDDTKTIFTQPKDTPHRGLRHRTLRVGRRTPLRARPGLSPRASPFLAGWGEKWTIRLTITCNGWPDGGQLDKRWIPLVFPVHSTHNVLPCASP